MSVAGDLGAMLTPDEARSIASELRTSGLPSRASRRAYPVHRELVKPLLRALVSEQGDAGRASAVLYGIAAVPRRTSPEVVWTSPSVPGSKGGTTISAVNLINSAHDFVFASTYSAQPQAPQLVALRHAMDKGISVTVVVDVRQRADCAAAIYSALPEARLWTLAGPDGAPWAIQHSKIITVDDRASFVTSANFSFTAVNRSLECGLLDRDAETARAMREHLERLRQHGVLVDYGGDQIAICRHLLEDVNPCGQSGCSRASEASNWDWRAPGSRPSSVANGGSPPPRPLPSTSTHRSSVISANCVRCPRSTSSPRASPAQI